MGLQLQRLNHLHHVWHSKTAEQMFWHDKAQLQSKKQSNTAEQIFWHSKNITNPQSKYIAIFLGTCFDIAKKHCKYTAFFLHSQQNLKNAIFAGKFAKKLQCICKHFAVQQLILYFLMVFVANSLQIACAFFIFASYLQQKPLKNENMEAICKLFANKNHQKV